MMSTFPLRDLITQLNAPNDGSNSCLQGLNGIDVITPGTSTVATLKTVISEFARFEESQTQRRVNAIMYIQSNDANTWRCRT